MSKFETELQHLLNCHSKENGSNTPDFMLAEYLIGCLENFNKTVAAREVWYGREMNTKVAVPAGLTFEIPYPPEVHTTQPPTETPQIS